MDTPLHAVVSYDAASFLLNLLAPLLLRRRFAPPRSATGHASQQLGFSWRGFITLRPPVAALAQPEIWSFSALPVDMPLRCLLSHGTAALLSGFLTCFCSCGDACTVDHMLILIRSLGEEILVEGGEGAEEVVLHVDPS